MGYQFFLPMVLRWRASRAEAPLSRVVAISFPEFRSPWPAVGKRELWEQPFQACHRCSPRLRSEPDNQNSVIFYCHFKTDALRPRFPTAFWSVCSRRKMCTVPFYKKNKFLPWRRNGVYVWGRTVGWHPFLSSVSSILTSTVNTGSKSYHERLKSSVYVSGRLAKLHSLKLVNTIFHVVF